LLANTLEHVFRGFELVVPKLRLRGAIGGVVSRDGGVVCP